MRGNKEDEKRFEELMKRDKKVDEYYYFTDDEIKFMGRHDLIRFGDKFPAEAYYYMQEF
ncbi:MAG TPA: hypothetical protein GXX42_12825 [Petrimonas sp.]|uniref:hypothetical protein n=1 Tax=Petrimonas sp. TaxID=2023866 RepID=UPI001764552C|nr:hypothetical protein [Petrimonas sp.]